MGEPGASANAYVHHASCCAPVVPAIRIGTSVTLGKMKRGFYIPQFESLVERSFSEPKRERKVFRIQSCSDDVAGQITSLGLWLKFITRKALALKSRVER